MQAFLDTHYEYHWTPLIGCLVGQLKSLGLEADSATIGAATGALYLPPGSQQLPRSLKDGLAALGANATTIEQQAPNRLQRAIAHRRIRRELSHRRCVTALGCGETPFGPDFGLIVGCDDQRRAWRRDGPMTEQISPWIAESQFNQLTPLRAIFLRNRKGAADAAMSDGHELLAVAIDAFAFSRPAALRHLREQIAILQSDTELEPQRHAHHAQSLAANWGEGASFWRSQAHPELARTTRQVALTLSRFATLFPYPMGGQPNHPAFRDTAVRILQEVVSTLDQSSDRN